jgi:hypothetical protein
MQAVGVGVGMQEPMHPLTVQPGVIGEQVYAEDGEQVVIELATMQADDGGCAKEVQRPCQGCPGVEISVGVPTIR